MGDVIVKQRTLKNGKTVYEYAFEIASIDGKRKRKTKSGFTTKKEAKEAGKLAQQEYENVGVVIESSDISFSDFLDKWIELDCRLTCKDVTVKGYEKKIRLYIKPALGHYRLKAINKDILQSFITDMYNKGFSVNTLSSMKGILSKAFNFAVDRHYINVSPAVRLVTPKNLKPKIKTRQKKRICISDDQMNTIFERFPESSPSYIPLKIAYHTGLRLGEIFALTWDDIDFKNKVLTVNRQVQWFQGDRTEEDKINNNGMSVSNGYWYFSSPKYKSYRKVDLDDNLINILQNEYNKQYKARDYYEDYYSYYYSEYELTHNAKEPNYTVPDMNVIDTEKTSYSVDFVCRREDGSYVNPRTMHHVSQIIHNKLNFKEFDIHSIRHTHATKLMENGIDLVYIQHRLGHKDISVTMNIYTNHLTDKIQESNNSKLNNIYN